ncbi:hypothetical protein NL676_030947 [Syzygium grande]|nr:hypothetical protein NL676_030947 [Syzygium grande]
MANGAPQFTMPRDGGDGGVSWRYARLACGADGSNILGPMLLTLKSSCWNTRIASSLHRRKRIGVPPLKVVTQAARSATTANRSMAKSTSGRASIGFWPTPVNGLGGGVMNWNGDSTQF